jgi:acetyl esterase/lipase
MNEERLWSNDAPALVHSGQVEKPEDSPDPRYRHRHLSGVTIPTITIFPAPPELANGMAVVVCPGGGYRILSMDTEGLDVTKWLNGIGITAVLLKYRLQPYGETKGLHPPLLDAQRALRIVRSRARQLKINPERVGMVGFSAGGHLTCLAATHFDYGNPKSADPIERQGCRPDFIMPIYTGLDDRILARISPDTPPAFIVTATDDFLADLNVKLFEALRRIAVPVELHFFQKGGHGFGLGMPGTAINQWSQLAAAWIREIVAPMPRYSPTPALRPVPKERLLHKRINCGAVREFQDRKGYIWEPDWKYTESGRRVDRGPIKILSTDTPELYRSERWGMDTIRVPLAAGTYTVRLHFAETFDGITEAGQRVFNVSLQGKSVIEQFDPFAEAGKRRQVAVVKSFAVTVKGGGLKIGFAAVKEQPMINAIEVAARS